MKLLKVLAIAAVLSTSLTACLKDKTAETTTTTETTVEQTAPVEGQPTEAAPAAPADAGTTQSN